MVADCGLLYGAPRRKDGSASLLFDPGSAWTLPMYSCMSTVKASIKTVTFRFNNTDDLSGLSVIAVQEKTYPDEMSKPLWAVEQSNMSLQDGNPLWGLVTEESAKQVNVSTLRKESLYLPGFAGNSLGAMSSHQNLPSADFPAIALGATYTTGGLTSNAKIDYSGGSNLALYRLWQERSRTAGTAANILNLIWTDIATNLVIGTKGLGTRDTALKKREETSSGSPETPQVTNYTRRIRYKYVYGIPAFMALLLVCISACTTLFFMLFGHAQPSTMRTFLQNTSAGRFLTAQSGAQAGYATSTAHEDSASPSGGDEPSNAPTKIWVKQAGHSEFTLGPGGWTGRVQVHRPRDNKGQSTTMYRPVPNSQDQ
jgi:hypothetical protein